MALIVNTANAPTVDETSLLQNATATAGVAGDDTDNDIAVASIDGSAGGGLPSAFEARLFALMGATTPLQVSLSGYTGAAGNTGGELVSISNAYIDLAFTDAQGDALGDPANDNLGADWSGLYAIDGTKIFLFTDTDNNIVIGRKGNANGTSDPGNDTPDSGGAIQFAAYLEETKLATSGSAKVWVVQFAPLKHGNVNDPDDAVTMANHLWVSATADLSFDFAGLPSGQNKFLMFQASGGSNVGLVVTGMDPDKVNDKGNDVGDTVNTSQGGGPTTIGTNNQSIDPPKGSAAGEGMIFTFVNRPNPDYTVPNLTHGEAVDENNIDYDYDPGNVIPSGQELFGASGATFFIAQQTPPKSATARISAFTTAFEEMSAYFDGLLDANDLANRVTIATVTVMDAAGNAVAGLDGVADDADHTVAATDGSGITVHWNQGGAEGALGTVTIAGFLSGFQLQYTTSGTHNRVLIENVGGSNGNSPFDIGGFHLPNIVTTPQEVGTYVAFEDDAPKLIGSDSTTVDEDGLTGLSVGIAGGDGDVVVADDGDGNEATNSGLLSTIFAPGNDGLGAYGMDDAGLASIKAFAAEDLVTPIALKSKGDTVLYDVIGNVLWGFVNVGGVATEYEAGTDRPVFKLDITNTTTGAWVFTLLDQLDHPTLDGATGDNTENDLVLHLGSVLKITDKDGDARFGASDSLKITVDDDTPTAAGDPVGGTVDEDALTGLSTGIDDGPGDVGLGVPATKSGTIATIFASGADEDLTYGLSATTGGIAVYDPVTNPALDAPIALTSKGAPVLYQVVGGTTLWGFVNVGGVATEYEAGTDRPVFKLEITNTATGAYTFTLLDQLDHPTLNGAAGDDTENELLLHLGSILQATDKDGDTVIAAAPKLAITVDDDTPTAAGDPVGGTVDEDALTGLSTGIDGGPGDVGLGVPATTSGTIATIFASGADEDLTYGLSATTGGIAVYDPVTNPALDAPLALTSKGGTVLYQVVGGTTLWAFVNVDGVATEYDGTDRAVFKLEITNTATGAYTFTLLDQLDHPTLNGAAGDDTENELLLHLGSILQATDKDGDTVIAAAPKLAITVDDDTPTAAGDPVGGTVDEDALTGLSTGIDDGPGDVGLGVPATKSGTIATIFASGADEDLTYGLSATTGGIAVYDPVTNPALDAPLALTSKGGTVLYQVVGGTTLWAFVNVDGVATEYDGTDRAVFKLEITNTATGAYTFTLLDQLDHPTLNGAAGDDTENELLLHLGSILQATDKDGDTVIAAAPKLAITVDDDTPVFRSISNIVAINTADPLTGYYDVGAGADDTGNTAADGLILETVSATTSGGRANLASPAPTVTWQTESAASVTYAFSFKYYTSSAPSTDSATATGTVTFNKTNGTYVLDLDNPITGTTTFSTSDVAGLITYNTVGNNSPEITVKEYASDFVGVLYARTTDGGQGADEDMNAGGDHTFTPPEVFDSVQAAYINVSTDTLGADSDTLQPYEILNFDFFEDNPVVPASPSGTQDNPVSTPTAAINFNTAKAYGETVSITLNQININGEDDVAILVKLQKPGTNLATTRLLLANAASDYVDVGNQNHVVTVGTDDYATEYAAGYRIFGVQVLASTGQVTDGNLEAYALSTGAQVSLSSGNGTYADSSDNDVLKIVKIDVTSSRPADADLAFTGKYIDADGDATGAFGFTVHLEGDSLVLAGGSGSDSLIGTSAAETLNGGAGIDYLTGGGGADQFVFATGDTGITLAAADIIVDFVTGVDKIATSKAAGDATIADGGALADFAAFVAAANAVLTAGAGTDDQYVAYNAAGSGNAWAVVDENDSGSVDAGDTLIVLTGINLITEVAAADFV